MTKYLLNAACLSLLALVAVACGDPNANDADDEFVVDEFVRRGDQSMTSLSMTRSSMTRWWS